MQIRRTFLHDLDDVIRAEADLVRVLSVIIVDRLRRTRKGLNRRITGVDALTLLPLHEANSNMHLSLLFHIRLSWHSHTLGRHQSDMLQRTVLDLLESWCWLRFALVYFSLLQPAVF